MKIPTPPLLLFGAPLAAAQTGDIVPQSKTKLLVKYTNSFGKFSTSPISTRSINIFDDNEMSFVDKIASSAKIVSTKGQISQVEVEGDVDSAIEALLLDEDVDDVELDYPMYKFPPPRDEYGSQIPFLRHLQEATPYGIKLVQAPELWSITDRKPTPVKICIVDTGYDFGHVDLPTQGLTSSNTEFINALKDGDGHGTHVAGIIGALGNQEGVVGVNPTPKTISFHISKALGDDGRGSASTVIEGIEGCLEAGAKVITLSLGGKESKIQEHLLKAAYDDGVLLFAASGNSGTDVKEYPASYPCVISVSAVGEDEEYASFSNFNDQVELVGPGVNIKSTTPGNSYGILSGTSMAAPHVAGAAALLWSFFPECSNQQIRNVLASTARDVNPSKTSSGCNIKTGFGLVQAKAAFDVLATFGCDAAGGHDTLPLSDRAEGGCHTLSNTLKTIADIPSTQTPTNTPTLRPTKTPTPRPSIKPTLVPSKSPTASPSTRTPSASPSVSESELPSASPSFRVFREPLQFVSSPSLSPSRTIHEGSSTPTPYRTPTAISPSSYTFQTPTFISSSPTAQSSSSPSKESSGSPSDKPSNLPSSRPSNSPSAPPSSIPSTYPSALPSGSPSSKPSMSPSGPPSSKPSMFPSTTPSHFPSKLPSNNPSVSPSKSPSALPSTNPSAIPSTLPSIQHSDIPSDSPSSTDVFFKHMFANDCDLDEDRFDIEFTLDADPSKVYWFLLDTCANNTIIYECKDCYASAEPYSVKAFGGCVPKSRFVFHFADYSGNDWMQGGYAIKYNGVQVFGSANDVRASEEVSFGSEECSDLASIAIVQPTKEPSPSPKVTDDFMFSTKCLAEDDRFDIEFTFDADPSKVYWFLLDTCASNSIVFECKDCYASAEPYSVKAFGGCVPKSRFVFHFADYSGNDWTQGGYAIKYNGVQVFDNTNDVRASEEVSFGSEECSATTLSSQAPISSQHTSQPVLVSSLIAGCGNDEARFDIQFTLDAEPSKVYWYLINQCSGSLIFDCQGCYAHAQPFSSKYFMRCLPKGGYLFSFNDYSGVNWSVGGYVMNYNSTQVFDSVGNVEASQEVYFGDKSDCLQLNTKTPAGSALILSQTTSTAAVRYCEQFSLDIATGIKDSKISWTLQQLTGNNIGITAFGPIEGQNYKSNSEYIGIVSECLPPGEYQFVIRDSDGGIDNPGYYKIFLNEIEIREDSGFGLQQVTGFVVRDRARNVFE